MNGSPKKRNLFFGGAIAVLSLVVIAIGLILVFGTPDRTDEERRFLGTWVSEDTGKPRRFSERYMAEFDGEGERRSVGLWNWSVTQPGRLRFFKYVRGRTIEEFIQYRIEDDAIVYVLDDGTERKSLRSDTPIPEFEQAIK